MNPADADAVTTDVVGPRLYVIGTPIGNLGDLSPRARETLGRCDLIACEDTRRTGRLFAMSGVRAPRLLRLDDHTEDEVASRIVERMSIDGSIVGLVSDAGMPGISDPGSRLVSTAIAADVPVEVVPGPFAGVVALVSSGLVDGDARFVFEGFLPRRSTQRRQRLGELASERRPVIVYESPHRLLASLGDMAQVLGSDRYASVSRELTKMHEETIRGPLEELVRTFEVTPPRGEFVIVIDGAPEPPEPRAEDLLAMYRRLLDQGMSSRDAVRRTAESLGVAPNTVKRVVFGNG